MCPNTSTSLFFSGLVFGFDVGTASIGYAVRKKDKFLDVGVLICPEETAKLDSRRNLRRQRRTLRSRKYRRTWFVEELKKLGLPKPTEPPPDPITLRLRALNGEQLKPEELHAALAHLFKRRGYSEVPWANLEKAAKETAKPKKDDDEGEIIKAANGIKAEMEKRGCQHPCQYLMKRREEVGQSPTEKWGRKIYWLRELLEGEFRAIAQAQEKHFPELAKNADRLLFGETHQVKRTVDGKEKHFHVFFNATGLRNPGVLGLRWPRFDNRGPAQDAYLPVDEQGRPLHVVRKNKEAFSKAQWELALMNFRVIDTATRQKRDPQVHYPVFVEKLRNEWTKKSKVTIARLKKLAEPFKDQFLLIDGQKPLTPETGSGRAKYSSPTLEVIRQEIAAGRRVDPPQPSLQRKGESAEEALNRYLADIKHPLVRHRLVLFRGLLTRLVSRFGKPGMIVIEAVRSLALGQKAKNKLNRDNEKFRKERENAREDLASNNESVSRKAIQRYRLWHETRGRCPFCLQTIERTELGHGADIEHLVPRSLVDCNEYFNLTVSHIKCNRELKGDRTPYAAFHSASLWPDIKHNAENVFSGRKLEIFLNPNAEELIEQRADLQHTAYIARVIRHVALIQLGWLNEEGRDPTPEKQNAALRFQVTNGQLTSRLRKAWGLNQILHPLPPGMRWDELAEEKQFTEKNRGDLRHHALDAMVIACTLPWLAHRTFGATDEFGNHGWWTQDEKQRSKAANPVFPGEGEMHRVCKEWMAEVIVRHHVSHSNHQQAYATTLYAKKAKNTYVAREVFTTLTPKNLGSIWPKEFAAYCEAAWSQYVKESPNIDAELKKTKGCIPESFTNKLCFSHFQQWRADGNPAFSWPEKTKIPIRNVRLISVKDDTAVVPFSSGTHAYVKRTSFKEVRFHPSEDGKSLVPVFIPRWRLDKPIPKAPIRPGSKAVEKIRLGQVVEIKNSPGRHTPNGKYRVASTMQQNIKLLPVYLADQKESLKASGFLENGVNISWETFIKAAGYELPHSPSSQSQSPNSDQA